MIRIGIDFLGGDHAPHSVIAGLKLFLTDTSDVRVFLYSTEKAMSEHLSEFLSYQSQIDWVICENVITMSDHPARTLKSKPNNTISKGIADLYNGHIDAYISAGNTGAMLVASIFAFQNESSKYRPTIASPFPRKELDGYNLILDVGLNADCKPDQFVDFALLASSYMTLFYGKPNPKVGLLNIGEEKEKGNMLTKAAYPLLEELPGIHFVGNVEGRDVFTDKADIILCEGFMGNVMLKMAESIYTIFHDQRGIKDPLLDQFNYEIYGGTPILGLPKPAIIGHGNSSAKAFQQMLINAQYLAQNQIMSRILE